MIVRIDSNDVNSGSVPSLQSQIKELIVDAIAMGQLRSGDKIPSSRDMAQRLGVSRNTVTLAYVALLSDGFLASRERSGFFVAETPSQSAVADQPHADGQIPDRSHAWREKFAVLPSRDHKTSTQITDWYKSPFPFVYGQIDETLFPMSAWRDCVRQAMSRRSFNAWTDDLYSSDDPLLLEAIRKRVLNKRGIFAKPEEILITLGAQNALYMLARLFVKPGVVVGIEDPGFHEARNIFALSGATIRPVSLDEQGIMVDQLGPASLAFVTPSHQFPTNLTMTAERRYELIDWANRTDGLVIEDDYEFETNFRSPETSALKALDRSHRVVYVGSLSKSLMPGIRIGFVVAHPDVITELRALRRLSMRHPPGNNQRSVALFLLQGHHDAVVKKLQRVYAQRSATMGSALEEFLPGWSQVPGFGGSSYWVQGPENLSVTQLVKQAADDGVLIAPGCDYFFHPDVPDNSFRVGYSAIPEERIRLGIEKLAGIAMRLLHTGRNGRRERKICFNPWSST